MSQRARTGGAARPCGAAAAHAAGGRGAAGSSFSCSASWSLRCISRLGTPALMLWRPSGSCGFCVSDQACCWAHVDRGWKRCRPVALRICSCADAAAAVGAASLGGWTAAAWCAVPQNHWDVCSACMLFRPPVVAAAHAAGAAGLLAAAARSGFQCGASCGWDASCDALAARRSAAYFVFHSSLSRWVDAGCR